jgi:hypothetical protein
MWYCKNRNDDNENYQAEIIPEATVASKYAKNYSLKGYIQKYDENRSYKIICFHFHYFGMLSIFPDQFVILLFCTQ